MATSILSSLTLATKPIINKADPTYQRQQKLISKLQEQKEMAQCALENKEFTICKDKWVVDSESGERNKVQVRKKIRPWYINNNGKVYFEVRYGNKALELSKGKNAIEIEDKNQLPNVIDTIIKAVRNGEMDTQLTLASKSVNKKK